MAKKGYVKADETQEKAGKVFSLVQRKWLPLTPEERVRRLHLHHVGAVMGIYLDSFKIALN